jgi:hypothetical protein
MSIWFFGCSLGVLSDSLDHLPAKIQRRRRRISTFRHDLSFGTLLSRNLTVGRALRQTMPWTGENR